MEDVAPPTDSSIGWGSRGNATFSLTIGPNKSQSTQQAKQKDEVKKKKCYRYLAFFQVTLEWKQRLKRKKENVRGTCQLGYDCFINSMVLILLLKGNNSKDVFKLNTTNNQYYNYCNLSLFTNFQDTMTPWTIFSVLNEGFNSERQVSCLWSVRVMFSRWWFFSPLEEDPSFLLIVVGETHIF